MKPNEINRLILTITLAIAVLLWGTFVVFRTVPNNNYHAPAPLSQQEVYTNCINSTQGSTSDLHSDCAKIAGVSK